MIEDVKKLTVKYNGKIVGYLAQLDDGIAFQYDEKWLKNGFNISPFSLPLEDKVFINRKDIFEGLFGVFADCLPDGWGELLVVRMLAKQGINYSRLSPLTKLTFISGQGLGGLTFEPNQSELNYSQTVELDQICRQVNDILNDDADNATLDEIFRLGGSSGGARPKAHIKIDGEEWIVKFPCRLDPPDIGEEEYKANLAAKRCGFSVNECRLFPSENCSGYFGAKRFDRTYEGRVHMISLSSLLETSHRIPNLDYIHLIKVTQRICADECDVYEAFGRMCFNVFYGNKDDHGKNFSFLFDEKKDSYKLSPFYDITRTPDKAEHEMTATGSGNPTEKDLIEVARQTDLDIGKCKKIISHINAYLNK